MPACPRPLVVALLFGFFVVPVGTAEEEVAGGAVDAAVGGDARQAVRKKAKNRPAGKEGVSGRRAPAAEPPAAPGVEASPDTSLLRVTVSSQGYNFRLPWQKSNPVTRRGLGALLPGGRVLATAEIVANANFIELEAPASGNRATAKVVAVDYEANLAVVEPVEKGDEVFEGMVPFEIDTSAAPGDKIEVWQIETNGTPVTTPVTISQAEIGFYFVPGHSFLTYKAAGSVLYRAGSFTLPVARHGKLAGLLLSYSSNNQISTILPAPIIQHFLSDLDDGEYEGFPSLGIRYAPTTDDQLRDYVGMGGREGGVYVTNVVRGASAAEGGVEVGDVLLELGGHAIDSRGNYEHPLYGLLNLSHLVRGQPYVGGEIRMKVLRDGMEKTLTARLRRKPPEDYLVDPYMFDRGPRNLLMGGLLFQELTRPYLQSFGDKWESRAPFKLVYASGHPDSYEKEGRRKLVFIGGVLPSMSTQGYERLGGALVESVNGVDVRDLKEVARALRNPRGGLHEIRFDGRPGVIWLDDELAKRDNAVTLPQRYRVPALSRLD